MTGLPAEITADTFTHTVPDGTVLHVARWLPEGEPRAVVQLAHGMVEHVGRYDHLGRRLAGAGHAVYASDHRGHGQTATCADDLGHLGDVNGFADVVDDLADLTRWLRGQHPGVPVVLLGHSMGSFLARAYAVRHGDLIDGLVLSGTAGDPGAAGRVGRGLAELEVRLRGPRARSRLMEALTLGPNNLRFLPARTRFDWLSRDPEQVDAYMADEACGGLATAAFYRDLLTGLLWVSHPSTVERMRPDLPVHIVVGEVDPVGGAEAAVEVAALLRGAGVEHVTVRIWPGGRHEVLNEINRDEVEDDLVAWLDERF